MVNPAQPVARGAAGLAPRGISRHVVRFVRVSGTVYAIKELPQQVAEREYRLLNELGKREVPVVRARSIISERTTDDGEPLDAALVTKHLRYSLPYRACSPASTGLATSCSMHSCAAARATCISLASPGKTARCRTRCSDVSGCVRGVSSSTPKLASCTNGTLRRPTRARPRHRGSSNIVLGELLRPRGRVPARRQCRSYRRRRQCDLALRIVVDGTHSHRVRRSQRVVAYRTSLATLNDLGYDVGELQLIDEPGGSRLKLQTRVYQRPAITSAD